MDETLKVLFWAHRSHATSAWPPEVWVSPMTPEVSVTKCTKTQNPCVLLFPFFFPLTGWKFTWLVRYVSISSGNCSSTTLRENLYLHWEENRRVILNKFRMIHLADQQDVLFSQLLHRSQITHTLSFRRLKLRVTFYRSFDLNARTVISISGFSWIPVIPLIMREGSWMTMLRER